MPTEEELIDELISTQKRLKTILDSKGLIGKCSVISELEVQSGVTGDMLQYHLKLFGHDLYSVEVSDGTHCTRDAVTKMEEMLVSALV